jgi:hypothetical protein
MSKFHTYSHPARARHFGPMGRRSAHEHWSGRNEPVHYHRRRECAAATSIETAARGALAMRCTRIRLMMAGATGLEPARSPA